MNIYKLFLITFFIVNPLFLHAQYFDWVERYTGSDIMAGSTNCIRQCVVDKESNIYFAGSCAVDAGFHNNVFLPISPYGQNWNMACAVIGKISAEGNLVWSKVIYGNMSHHGGGLLQLLGDTAFALCTTIGIPRPHTPAAPPTLTEYLFYFDTLMTFLVNDSIIHNGSFLFSYADCSSLDATAYIVFNLDGEIIEQHWLTVSLLNQNGEPYNMFDRYENGPELSQYVQAYKLMWDNSLFCTDKNGNIYISRQLMGDVTIFDSVPGGEKIDINSPEVSGMRINIDGKRHIDLTLPEIRPSIGYYKYQIMKFSPHFDSLLASQFLFEPTPEHLDTICEIKVNDLKCDNDGNVYLIATNGYYYIASNGEANSLKIGGSDSIYLHFQSYDTGEGFLIKYDTLLNPVYLRQYKRDTSIVISGSYGLGSAMWACQFDDDGILTILGGASSMDSAITSCFFDTAEVELDKTFIRINPDDGTIVNQAATISAEQCSFGGSGAYFTDFVASGNRLIWQFKYRWYLNFADSLYEKPQEYEWGMGFAVWDYDGNELCFVDYGVNGSVNNGTRSMCLQDSVLYLTGMLASGGAQFGDITVPNSGSSQSFIARYVDTAFMHPYVRPGSQQDIQLVVRDGEPVVTVYPNPCAQRVTIDWDGEEPLASAFVTDISGRTYDVNLSAAGQGRYTVDFSSMPSANYLLTLVTASGHRITSRLLKR